MQKISTRDLLGVLRYVHTNVEDLGTLSSLVAGILLGSNFSQAEEVVCKMLELKQLSKDIELSAEKELIMHSTHTLRKFTKESDDMIQMVRVKLEAE